MTDGFIYFARAKSDRHGNLFKIGFSRTPRWRVQCLLTADNPAIMIDYFPGTMDEELALHALLDLYRVCGEWYRAGRRVHRIMLYCIQNRSVPPLVVELADRRLSAKLAKREMQKAHKDASMFLSDFRNFGMRQRCDDPFMINPPQDDLGWLHEITAAALRARSQGGE